MTPIDEDRAERVCLIGKGTAVCRYLGRMADDWMCLKNGPVAHIIEKRAPGMNAKGDNCPGPPFTEEKPS